MGKYIVHKERLAFTLCVPDATDFILKRGDVVELPDLDYIKALENKGFIQKTTKKKRK